MLLLPPHTDLMYARFLVDITWTIRLFCPAQRPLACIDAKHHRICAKIRTNGILDYVGFSFTLSEVFVGFFKGNSCKMRCA